MYVWSNESDLPREVAGHNLGRCGLGVGLCTYTVGTGGWHQVPAQFSPMEQQCAVFALARRAMSAQMNGPVYTNEDRLRWRLCWSPASTEAENRRRQACLSARPSSRFKRFKPCALPLLEVRLTKPGTVPRANDDHPRRQRTSSTERETLRWSAVETRTKT